VISPKVEGYIKEVPVEENQEVAAGQVLIVVDDRDFAAKTTQAEAVVATEEAIVATYASRLGSQQAMIDQAAATVQSAEADLNRHSSITSATRASSPAILRAGSASKRRKRIPARPKRRSARRAALVAEQSQLAVLARKSARKRRVCYRPAPACS